MDIYCYRYDASGLVLLGVVDDFVSFSFTRSYSGIGAWQLVLDGQTLNANRVKGMDIIRAGDGVAGLVERISETKDGEYTVTYTGRELKALACRRIVEPPLDKSHLRYVNEPPEAVMVGLLHTQLVAASAARAMPHTAIGPYSTSGTRITYEGRFQDVADELVTIASTYGIGWYADVEAGIITYQIYHGIDRTHGQSANSRLTLSMANDNMQTSLYEYNKGRPNVVLVAGQGEGVEREIVRVGDAVGFSRTEIYQDARDVETGATEVLTQRAIETLASYGDDSNYETTFSASFARYYRQDYDLGDQGTILDDVLPGGTMDFRLAEITEIYEGDEMTLGVTFGYAKGDLADAISRSMANANSLLRTEQMGIQALFDLIYPVGSIYMSVSSDNPSGRFGGTWVEWGSGRVPVGIDRSQAEFNAVEKTGGENSHTLGVEEMPEHAHTLRGVVSLHSAGTGYFQWPKEEGWGTDPVTNINGASMTSVGGGAAHNNLQPYITCYMWKRTA